MKLKAEKKAAKKADKALKTVVKASKSKVAPKRKTVLNGAKTSAKTSPHARGTGKPTRTKSSRTKPLSPVRSNSPDISNRASST